MGLMSRARQFRKILRKEERLQEYAEKHDLGVEEAREKLERYVREAYGEIQLDEEEEEILNSLKKLREKNK